MKNFVKFMVSIAGRITRIIAGVILILIGILAFPIPSWILIIIGLIPLSAGIFDFCLLAPLFGYYINAKKTREALNK